MERHFKIKENGFSEIKPTLLKIIPLLSIPLIIGLAIKSKGFTTNFDTLLFVTPIVIGIFVLAVYIGIKRAEKQFESYELIINDNDITRRQLYVKVKEVSIPIKEIISISRDKKGRLTIKGKSDSPLQIIFVPIQIENFEKLTEILEEILPIKMK